MIQETLVLVKPDGMQKNIIGAVIEKCERAEMEVVGLKMIKPTDELAAKHYRLTEE